MKALIWIGCFFVYTFLNEILGLAIGFRLGYFFTLIIPFAVAKKLCAKWDAHIIREKAKKRGVTPFEFFKAELPPIVINGCEASRGDKEALKQFLKRRLERSEVSKGQVIILMEEYMKPKTAVNIQSSKPEEQSSPPIRLCEKCGEKLLENSKFCRKCGEQVNATYTSAATTNKSQGFAINPTVLKAAAEEKSEARAKDTPVYIKMFSYIAIALYLVVGLAVLVAMNVQDYDRNIHEDINPTILYFIILALNIAFAVLSFVIIKTRSTKAKAVISVALVVLIFVAVMIYSGYPIWSTGYHSRSFDTYYEYIAYHDYVNTEKVNTLNVLGLVAQILALITNAIITTPLVFKLVENKWHSSMAYRERCYKKVAKIHGYFSAGIITQAEYEKTKADILKKVK